MGSKNEVQLSRGIKSLLLKGSVLLTLTLLVHPILLKAQEVIKLYPDNRIPNAKPAGAETDILEAKEAIIKKVITPTLEVYLPEKKLATGTAVIICPGGSYKVLVYQGEGVTTAKAFAKKGVAAFVLRYRLPDDRYQINKTIAPLQDAQQAIKLVRQNANKWGIDTAKVGIVGFSAGGHLAATLATHYQPSLIENSEKVNLRPDFQILIYPVISMQDSLTHKDSRNNLLGSHPSQDTINSFSNELQVDKNTPPAYLAHAEDDKVVDADNIIDYFEALRHHQVSAELHIYPHGGHGFIFGQPDWTDSLFKWMKTSKWIE